MRSNVVALLALAFLLRATPAYAEDIPPSPIVKAELLLDAAAPQKGDTVWAGVRFSIPEHWHIYWKNPGDSGIPTTLDWRLPEALKAGAIQWPAPERIEMAGLVNYGYSNEVTLPVPLQVTADAITGEVHVKANWLVCKETCIPESVELSAPFPSSTETAATNIRATRDALPSGFPGTAHFYADKKTVTLTLIPSGDWALPDRADFIPAEDGVIVNDHAVEMNRVGNQLIMRFPRGSADIPTRWHGVAQLAWDDQPTIAYRLTATQQPVPPAPTPHSFVLLLAFAFLGGLILNIMPCVLPILSLKALALVKKSEASPRIARAHGLAYTSGVVLSFLGIAAVMLTLKSSGAAIGWGFHLQSPAVVLALFILMLLVSLNLAGLFELPSFLGGVQTNDSTLRGSFLTGVLAVAVASPCTAPFMATAIGATLALPAALSLLIFSLMGLGLAAPFLLISFWPAARRLLPKPGAWMNRLRHILAVPMAATAAWLLFVFVQLVTPHAMPSASSYSLITPHPYSAALLQQLRSNHTPVLIDATAAWCITCKVNERVALHPQRTQQFLRNNNVTLLIADWTKRDAEVTQLLAQFGRNGVPLYVFYPAEGAPIVLPQVLTPETVITTLQGNMNKK